MNILLLTGSCGLIGSEAVGYFSDKFELLEKVQWLLKHPEEIDTIAKAGYEKSYKNGDDIKSRARYFLEIIKCMDWWGD
mgnify:CR=1 FL=1